MSLQASGNGKTTQGRIVQVLPHGTQHALHGAVWDVAGALVLPGLVDAHTHLDKAFTLPRMGVVKPGLLGAIEAMMVDRQGWTEADIHARASRALQWAYDAGTVHMRTHCDWWEPEASPLAWRVLGELARLQLDLPLRLFVGVDAKEATRHRLVAFQSGLGLPDRDDYFKTDAATERIRAGYRNYAQQLLQAAAAAAVPPAGG